MDLQPSTGVPDGMFGSAKLAIHVKVWFFFFTALFALQELAYKAVKASSDNKIITAHTDLILWYASDAFVLLPHLLRNVSASVFLLLCHPRIFRIVMQGSCCTSHTLWQMLLALVHAPKLGHLCLLSSCAVVYGCTAGQLQLL